MLFLKDKNGQMIVESVIAMGIIVTGIVSIVGLASRSIGQSRSIADEFIAINLAAEGAEVSKNILDANIINGRAWNQGFADGKYEVNYLSSSLTSVLVVPKNLLFDSSTKIYSYNSGEKTSFTRVIEVKNLSGNEIMLISEVGWKSRDGGNKSISVETKFLNWR